MQQSVAKMGGERTTANITEGGKILIKSDLQRLYPGYNPVVHCQTCLITI